MLTTSGPRSEWASGVLADVQVDRVYEVSTELMAELGQKDEQPPELIAVAALPADDLMRIPVRSGMLAVVFDQPRSPGNLGTMRRRVSAGKHRIPTKRNVLGWVLPTREGCVHLPDENLGWFDSGDLLPTR
ncbi:MAG TPA: hypothetical protein VFN75_01555, partial [Pseudonocardiaceae bacterium]|nr:hypothetical protein [Pseudonocardiaceae bacterium]